MKRILCAVLAAVMVLAAGITVSGASTSTMPAEGDVITVVGLLEIMNGDSYGNLNLDDYVKRSEFVKMALCASSLKDKINTGSNVSPFIDVRASHWAVGYVTTAVTNGYIKGYLDGTFKPDNQVTLEEAVTVMLRIMGYSELDSGKYPDTQLAKYEELEMNGRINATRGEALTRRECMYLMYNALCAKDKSGKIYCESLGYATDENGRIDYLALVGGKMDGPVVVYDDSYKKSIGFDLASGTVYRNNKKADASEIALYDVVYYNNKIRTAWCFSDKEMGIVDSATVSGITSNAEGYDGAGAPSESIIVSGKTYKLGNKSVSYKFSAYGTLAPDDFVMLLLDKDGNVADAVLADGEIYEKYADEDDDRVALINSTLKGPYVAKSLDSVKSKIPFDIGEAKIQHGTKTVTPDYILENDVYYYSSVFKSVWLYRDTATGFVTAVTPSRENPTAVTVGGKNYTLDGSEIKQQFSNFGTYEKDDFVTLLLGNGGTAVLAIDGDILDYANNNDDNVTYADLVRASMKGPVTVKSDGAWRDEIPFDIETAAVYKKNSTADASAISEYDVLYYSESLKSVWIYSDKVTGTLEAVSPNRISPSSITVSGHNYSLESSSAAFSVSNLGTFTVGEPITVLLGKDGGAVEIIRGTENAEAVYGFITAFGEKEYSRPNGTTYLADSIEILGVDAEKYTYPHEKLAFDKGDFVKVTFSGDEAVITKVTSKTTSAGATSVNSLIAKGAIADDAVLLDVYITGDSDSLENKSVAYVKLYPARLSGAKLTENDIYYSNTDGGVLNTLVLKNYTGDIHTYAVITSERVGGVQTFKTILGGKETSLKLNTAYGNPAIGPAKLVLKGGMYTVTSLDYVTVDKNGLGLGSITSEGKSYTLASSVEYYIRTNTRDFTLTTREDILEGDYTVKAYYDKKEANGGRIRVIVAE